MKPTSALQIFSRPDLEAFVSEGNVVKWLHFWGHTPAPGGAITAACLSQWWEAHPFEIEGITYATAEHFMMAEKARLFGDEVTRQKVLVCSHPNAAKKLGREVNGFSEAKWQAERWRIVVEGNFGKFSQHEELGRFLLKTGERILVEASPYDRIWGIGMAVSHPDATQPSQWKGLNLLGFALMEVRARLLKNEAF